MKWQICRNCGLLHKPDNVCLLTKQQKDPSADFCSSYRQNLTTCEICRNATLEPQYVPDADQWHTLCANCADRLTSCAFCSFGKDCKFENDPDPMPKIVVQQTRTPMGIAQTQVKNPARVDKFCKNCRCWSTDLNLCAKSNGYCDRIDHIYQTPTWFQEIKKK